MKVGQSGKEIFEADAGSQARYLPRESVTYVLKNTISNVRNKRAALDPGSLARANVSLG